jgi:hypothetical protein
VYVYHDCLVRSFKLANSELVASLTLCCLCLQRAIIVNSGWHPGKTIDVR